MQTYAVVGSGYMGGGIAQVLALSGASVAIADVSGEVARGNLARLVDEARAFEADGLFPGGAADTIAQNLTAAESIEEAVLIEELATAVESPERFLGVHFSNPAPFIPGVEIIAHAGTQEQSIVAAEHVVNATGKLPARVSDATGFVLNRLQYALFHEATQIVEEGIASAEDVDVIVRSTFGFRLPFFGPFAIADMAGLDVYALCYASLQTRWPERFATPASLEQHVAAGRFGTKTGAGYLSIPAEQTPEL
ncbi:MAG: 3-hydroxyacyl-CoA dehydrogenase, partial [Microbacterium sp.]|uniref:3-hydroxyacyl-CoA dehydrogenase family protein n=1 Tax=Microbacterium sp. TaxID=51671 RepID=UPI002624343C